MKNALVKLTREKISKLEKELLSNDHPSIVKGNTDFFPLKHSFSEGVYIREMLMEEGGIVIGKLHKYSHTWFLMKGEIMVATDLGTETYTAPCYVNAPAGAKRVIYAIEDSVFINVHPNPKNITNIEELENMLTCKSYEAFDKYKQLKQ
jgi:quercetin dioxygenase-like cupin family protein